MGDFQVLALRGEADGVLADDIAAPNRENLGSFDARTALFGGFGEAKCGSGGSILLGTVMGLDDGTFEVGAKEPGGLSNQCRGGGDTPGGIGRDEDGCARGGITK